MQNAARVILWLIFALIVIGGYYLIEAVIEPAVEKGRWGVVTLIAAAMSPAVGIVTWAWFAIH